MGVATPKPELKSLQQEALGSLPNPIPVGQGKHVSAGAVVMGADYRGLGLVRSLGRHGIPIWVLREEGELLATTSRYACRTAPWPTGKEENRLDFLVELGAQHRLNGWLLFPTTDAHVGLVARHHQLLGQQFELTTPPWDVLRWACDKRLLHCLAKDLAVDQPWSFCPRSLEDIVSLECRFPVIIKPAIRERFNRLTAAKAWRVNDRQSLLTRFEEACSLVGPDKLMIQEELPGSGEAQYSYAALCEEGRPLASVIARRLRQYPMDFGRASTYVETHDEPAVVEPSVRLLAAIRFTGLVEVEFKRDPRDGVYKLLDVNPRVWGWHTLCGRAGVDFPYLLWLLLHGKPVPEVRARTGIRWVRTSTDFPIALLEILRGRLPPGAYFQSLRGPLESAIFASDDPLPGLLELPLIVYKLGRRIFHGNGF